MASLKAAGAATGGPAAGELAASISEISRRVDESADIAQRAVSEMGRADGSVRKLCESAQRIGEIVALINGIAMQRMAGRTGSEAGRMLSASDTMSGQAADLRQQVDSLLTAMRAA